MTKLLKPYFHEIRPHLLYDVSKYAAFVAVSMIVAAVVFLYRFLLGYPRDLVLTGAISIGAFLLMSIAVFIARSARKTENEELKETNANLAREKQEVEAKLAEAQGQNKPPAQIISVPSILSCGDSKLHEIANEDRNSIEHLVTVTVIDPQPNKLTQGIAYIEFIFYIFNSSVFEISVDDAIDGYISFREGNHEDRLHEYKELKDNQAKAVPSRGQGHFTIYQRLTETEARHFAKTDDVWFSFNNLVITIKGANESDGVVEKHLDTNSKPTSTTIRWLYHEPEAAIAYRRTLFVEPKQDGDDEAVQLKGEITSLRAELARLTGLAFEVDTKAQSDVHLRAHRNLGEVFSSAHPRIEIDMYILVANLKVQFENHDVHRRALKRIELSLIQMQDEKEEVIPFLAEPVMLQLHPDKNGDKQLFSQVDFVEQSMVTYWLHFNAHVPRDPGERLDGNYFLRLTVSALGQQPLSEDLNVNWVEALNNASYLTSRPT